MVYGIYLICQCGMRIFHTQQTNIIRMNFKHGGMIYIKGIYQW